MAGRVKVFTDTDTAHLFETLLVTAQTLNELMSCVKLLGPMVPQDNRHVFEETLSNVQHHIGEVITQLANILYPNE